MFAVVRPPAVRINSPDAIQMKRSAFAIDLVEALA
jgi:hypothetical protein